MSMTFVVEAAANGPYAALARSRRSRAHSGSSALNGVICRGGGCSFCVMPEWHQFCQVASQSSFVPALPLVAFQWLRNFSAISRTVSAVQCG